MQTNDCSGFEPLPFKVAEKLDAVGPKYRTPEAVKEILRECPRPTLYLGEIINVKGMNFRVTRIKADGKVGLKMVPGCWETYEGKPSGPAGEGCK